MAFHPPEKYRLRTESVGVPTVPDVPYGCFLVPLKRGQQVRIVCSAEMGWEHVSVSRKDRCPTWEEMCQVKEIFWDAEDCVMQLHPPRSEWVNNHSFCLHLWRPTFMDIPRPPAIMVGVKEMGVLR